MRPKNFVLHFCFLSVCWLSQGCAQTAVVKCWEPAEIDVSGIHRIAIADFQGEHGKFISSTLSDQLWRDDFYSIVDRSQLEGAIQTAGFQPDDSLCETLHLAAKSGVDAVIVGSVLEYRCEDQVLQPTDVSRLRIDDDADDGSTAGGDRDDPSQNQTILREATVSVAVRLVDTETGDIRASKVVSKHYEGKIVGGVEVLPHREEILHQLSQECLDEIMEMLAPHESTFEMALAKSSYWTKGRSEVKAGLNEAKSGDWESAEKHWQAAIEINRDNAAAYYNLAVAAMQRAEYDLAESHALQALKIEHKDTYAEGLEQIRRQRAAHNKTEEQIDAQVMTPAESLWR